MSHSRIQLRKSPYTLIVISGSQVILIKFAVVLFSGVEVVVITVACLVNQGAEGVVVVLIGQGAAYIGQCSGAAQSVVLVVTVVVDLLLADQIQAVEVLFVLAVIHPFFHHLGVVAVAVDHEVGGLTVVYRVSTDAVRVVLIGFLTRTIAAGYLYQLVTAAVLIVGSDSVFGFIQQVAVAVILIRDTALLS